MAVVFTEPLDAASVSPTTIQLTRSGEVVAATVTLASTTANVTPQAPLSYGSTYTLTATTGVLDRAGNALSAEAAFSFTVTEPALPPSYEWQRPDVHFSTNEIRAGQAHGGFVLAHCFADFDGDGDADAVVAPGDGSPTPMPVEFYANSGGTLAFQPQGISNDVPGMVHARKCVVLDADGDGRLDAFVTGHGYDQPPFPGEAPVLLMNRAGGFAVGALPSGSAGFNHGASAGDADEDGDADIFVARQGSPYFLVNDGAGGFQLDASRVPRSLRGNLYTTELIDVDGDSHLDLLTAGHEQDGMASFVFWGNGTGRFDDAHRTILASVAGWGVVIDIDADDLDGDGDLDVVLNRTGDPSGLGFYVGYRLQFLMQDPSRAFVDVSDTRIPSARSSTAVWIPWVRLQDRDGDNDVDVHVEDAARALSWLNNGSGLFAP